MSNAVCPYCRTVIEPGSGNDMLCASCGAPHHVDCYAENGGCTVFGCSSAPADEQKLTLTGTDVAAGPSATSPSPGNSARSNLSSGGLSFGNLSPATSSAGISTLPNSAPQTNSTPEMLPGVGLMPPGWSPNAPPKPVKAAPPPMPPGAVAVRPAPVALPTPRFGSGSVLFAPEPPAPMAAYSQSFQITDFDANPNPNAKNRMTFIVLGILLGALGVHNFYAGYRGKATAQLCISVLTLGLASPMSWVWAVIDVSTVDRDFDGVKFQS